MAHGTCRRRGGSTLDRHRGQNIKLHTTKTGSHAHSRLPPCVCDPAQLGSPRSLARSCRRPQARDSTPHTMLRLHIYSTNDGRKCTIEVTELHTVRQQQQPQQPPAQEQAVSCTQQYQARPSVGRSHGTPIGSRACVSRSCK